MSATLRAFTAVWMGRVSLDQALREGNVTLFGPTAARREFGRWFGVSTFARLMQGR